jgi:tetratricopeptide (TPR) repeat protein
MNEAYEAALRRGKILLELGRAKEAEAQFRTALAAEPGNAVPLTLLARALLEQERYLAARKAGREALAADPENLLALSVFGAALAGLERYPDALDTVRRGLALAPELAGLHLQEASVLMAMERPADALDSIERARRLDPESSAAAVLHAGVLYTLHRYGEADDVVVEALRLDPENSEAHRIRGLIALRRGGARTAVAAHRTALRLDPTNAASRVGLSFILKSRNPVYRLLVRYGSWLAGLSNGLRVAMGLLPFVLIWMLRSFDGQIWAAVLILFVVTLVLLSWTIEPLMNCVLLLTRDRNLLTRSTRRATSGFLAFAGAALACAVVAMVTGPPQLRPVAVGLGFWAIVTGGLHNHRQREHAIGAGAAGLIGTMVVAATLFGTSGAVLGATMVFFTGAGVTALTRLAGNVLRH